MSVYLGSSEKKIHSTYFLSQFHSLIHQKLSEVEKRRWKSDLDKITNYLHQSRSNASSLVFFTSGKNFWQVLEFDFFLTPLCKVLYKPYLEPMEDALKRYQKYLVLLVDREKARLFTVHLGKIEEHEDIFDNSVPQNVKAKKVDYGRDNKIFRHIEDHLHRHLRLISNKTSRFAKDKNIHFIIIGGHRELLPKIKKHLPYPINKIVLGEFVTELNIPLSKVFRHSKEIASVINRNLFMSMSSRNR